MTLRIQLIPTVLGKFWCYEDTVGSALASGAWWDQQIQPFLDEADPNGWAIDLGAHIGWFTVYLARRFQGVVAVEAHPQTYWMLRRNVTMNVDGRRARLHNVGAFDRETPLTLAPAAAVGWPIPYQTTLEGCPHPASIAYQAGLGRLGEPWIWGTPVDALVQLNQRVTLIKVDVQGCDLRALVGLTRTIDRWRPLIVFEYESISQLHGDTWQDYLDFFAARTYTVERIREDLWDYVARPR